MKVAIIGGAGKMGRWFANYFIKKGHEVTISDIRLEEAKLLAQNTGIKLSPNNIKAVEDAELIIVSTPINVTKNVLREISGKVTVSTTLIEIASLKSQVFPELKRIARRGVKTISIHPLFGPGMTADTEEKIALIPVIDPIFEHKLAKTVFPKAEFIIVNYRDHDKAMALALSLPHFVNILFASVIGQEDINVLKKLGGTTFSLQLILSEGVMSEDPSLYASIQMDNKFTREVLEKLLSNAGILRRYIIEKDYEGFIQFFRNAKHSLIGDRDFGIAYERMYKALESLKE
ncbi:MAG: prephenate dehydrogenase/arogenate dehydrogenase family protein [Candidatus Jordarchaeaceae archaeon]